MRAVLLGVLIALAINCKKREPSTYEQIFTNLQAEARSSSVRTRVQGASGLGAFCCSTEYMAGNFATPREVEWLRANTCRELHRMLETETDPDVLGQLSRPYGSGSYPPCYAQFPRSTILGLCRAGCSSDARRLLVNMLSQLEPSPEIANAILHQLQAPHDEGERFDVHVALALADMGERDLGPVLALLASADPHERSVAVRSFSRALELAPLEMPALLTMLERLEADPDPETRLSARIAASSYREWGSASPDEVISRLVDREHWYDETIRVLAVRRFSCRAEGAVDALKRLGEKWGVRHAGAAVGWAIALREQRCGRPPND